MDAENSTVRPAQLPLPADVPATTVLVSECRQFLQKSTHNAHVRLNHQPLLAGITRPGYPLATYRRVLAAYFYFYQSIEASIDDFLRREPHAFDYAQRRKLPWLVADWHALSMRPDDPALGYAQPLEAVEILSAAHLAGVLYTIEGSTLGGQVISRQIAASLGLTVDAGARFFNGYGQQTAARWSALGVFLEHSAADALTRAQAATAALATFALLENVLNDFSGPTHAQF
ncbi:MAG: biliverdin-producing heme oxygenase [Pseudomonas sp.]